MGSDNSSAHNIKISINIQSVRVTLTTTLFPCEGNAFSATLRGVRCGHDFLFFGVNLTRASSDCQPGSWTKLGRGKHIELTYAIFNEKNVH